MGSDFELQTRLWLFRSFISLFLPPLFTHVLPLLPSLLSSIFTLHTLSGSLKGSGVLQTELDLANSQWLSKTRRVQMTVLTASVRLSEYPCVCVGVFVCAWSLSYSACQLISW